MYAPGTGTHQKYVQSGAFRVSLGHSVVVATATCALVTPMAFAYAYARARSCMPGKGFFKAAAYVPLLIPGILKAIVLICLFGNQGLLKSWLFGGSAYGPLGMVAALVMWTFPRAVLIIVVPLVNADQRLYQAAEVLQASPWRSFVHVTWPACRYGVITDALSVFVMVFTDFGIAKLYLFLRAMTTLSAIIFLYSAQTRVAAVAVIHFDETGATASAAAMAMLIVCACLVVRLLHHWLSERLLVRLQRWRQSV